MSVTELCRVCGGNTSSERSDLTHRSITCSNCGDYVLPDTMMVYDFKNRKDLHILGGVLKYASNKGTPITLTSENIDTLIANADNPKDPVESVDSLLRFIAGQTTSADSIVMLKPNSDFPLLYARSPDEYRYFLNVLKDRGYVKSFGEGATPTVRITFDGHFRLSEMKESNWKSSKLAFMAMPFNDERLKDIYTNHIQPAVLQTGFEIKRVDEGQPAGLIDDRLRVRIHNSRFLIAELTDDNRGVYWESGFAEGLGRPVIYMCKEKPDEKTISTHFDTNHLLTVTWQEGKIAEAMEKLKAAIRATLPAEALMEDADKREN